MKPRRCPWCGAGARVALRAGDRNRESTTERFDYARCTRCSTLFLAAPPSDPARFYAGDYYGFEEGGEPGWKRNPLLLAAEADRVQRLLRHVAPGALIEIGPGAGGFASAASSAGFALEAIEMDRGCCEYLREQIGVAAICSNDPVTALSVLEPARVVALWHVLEHMPDPAAVVRAASAKLEPGGVLALGVPNPVALQFRLLGRRWAHLDAPRHVCLIPAAALIARGRELGLRCVEVTSTDPYAVHSNMFGWANALRRRPARSPTPGPVIFAARVLTRAMAPIERRGALGAAITVLLRKDG